MAICLSECFPVWDAVAVSIGTGIVWALRWRVPVLASAAHSVVREALNGAILSADNPLPNSSATLNTFGNRACGSTRKTVVVAVGGRDIPLYFAMLSGD